MLKRSALISFAVFLLIVELGLRVYEASGGFAGAPMTNAALVMTEATSPRIVFLGSSHVQYAVAPVIVEQQLGLDQRQVVNLAGSAGMPIDFLRQYETYRPQFQDAEVLVIGIEDWQFDWGAVESNSGATRARLAASLAERWSYPGWRGKADWMLGWFSHIWADRDIEHYVIASRWSRLMAWFQPEASSSQPASVPVAIDDLGQLFIEADRQQRVPTDEEAIEAAAVSFADYRFMGMQLSALVKLVRMAQADGIRVVLLDVPVSPLTEAEVRAHYGAEDAAWRGRVTNGVGLPIVRVALPVNACDPWQRCYFDSEHMTREGAIAYSGAVAAWLRALAVD